MTEFFYRKEKIVFKGVFSQNGRFNIIQWLADLFELFTISNVSWILVGENKIFELKLILHKRQNGMKSIHVFNSCFSRNAERNLAFWQECECAQFTKFTLFAQSQTFSFGKNTFHIWRWHTRNSTTGNLSKLWIVRTSNQIFLPFRKPTLWFADCNLRIKPLAKPKQGHCHYVELPK